MTPEEIESKAREVYPEDITRIPQDLYPPMEIDNNAHKREGYIHALTEIESLPKIHGWVARDKDNELYFYSGKKPCRMYGDDDGKDEIWYNAFGGVCYVLGLNSNTFPEVTWNSEPVKVELLIRKL